MIGSPYITIPAVSVSDPTLIHQRHLGGIVIIMRTSMYHPLRKWVPGMSRLCMRTDSLGSSKTPGVDVRYPIPTFLWPLDVMTTLLPIVLHHLLDYSMPEATSTTKWVAAYMIISTIRRTSESFLDATPLLQPIITTTPPPQETVRFLIGSKLPAHQTARDTLKMSFLLLASKPAAAALHWTAILLPTILHHTHNHFRACHPPLL